MRTHFVMLTALSALCFATAGQAAPPQPQFSFSDTQIKALGVRLAPLVRSGTATGLAFPARVGLPPSAERFVSAPLSGLVTQILVAENEYVKPAQPLLRLQSPELAPLQARLLQAAAQARLASTAAARERYLFGEGIAARRRVDEAEARLLEANASLREAEAALELAGFARTDIARLLRSRNYDSALTVKAREAGLVTELTARPGQRIAAADPLMRIVDTRALWLDIDVPNARARDWPIGASIRVVGRDADARIVSHAGVIDPTTQTLSIRAQVTRAAQALRPGEVVQVVAPMTQAADAWDVPVASIARNGNVAVVFVRTAQGFEARPVTILASATQTARVRGRFTGTENIAVGGTVALKAAWLGEGGE